MVHFSLYIDISHYIFCICVIRNRLSLGHFVRLEPIKTPPMKEMAEAAPPQRPSAVGFIVVWKCIGVRVRFEACLTKSQQKL